MDQQAIDFILRITNQGLLITLVVCGPPIALSLFVGLGVSLFQAVTQIQEQTLTFVPKLVIIFGALAALGPWIGATLLRFTEMCFDKFWLVVY
jgi:flagellar biosynthesis protein FliQ